MLIHIMIDSRNLSLLPDVDELRRLLQSLAMLDAILCPERAYRYYSFNAAWGPGEHMGSMYNGSGDEFFVYFGPEGCWFKGFDHEAVMSPHAEDPPRVWPGVLDSVPDVFDACLREEAFQVENVTFCIWRRATDRRWKIGPISFPAGENDPDGSRRMLAILDGRPESYQAWATEYYEREVDLSAVEHIYQHKPLTAEIIARLNPELSLAKIVTDRAEIGYPE